MVKKKKNNIKNSLKKLKKIYTTKMSGIATESRWPIGTDATTTNGSASERNHNRYVPNRWFFVPTFQQFIGSQQTTLHSFDVTDNKTEATTNLTYNNKRIYRMNDIFHREDERLKTFEMWPLEWMDKGSLAQTGMFYTGDGDKVKCYFCEVEIGRWEQTDNPISEHMKWSPNCPLLRRRTTNNIPICAEALNRVLPPQSYDVCGANDSIEVRPYAYAEGSIVVPEWLTPSSSSSSSTTTTTTSTTPYYPEYPEYAIEAARCRSFADWPRTMKQKPNQLSEAGFFYTGVGDRVKCFSCGGGLKDWDESDEPWEQHALWLSKCKYLKLIKGQTYVDAVIAKYKSDVVGSNNSTLKCPTDAGTAAAASASADLKIYNAVCSTTQTEDQSTALNNNNNNNNSSSSNDETSRIATLTEAGSSNNSISNHHSNNDECSKNIETQPATIVEQSASQNAEKKCIPEEKLCKICYVGEYNTAFLPCGHVVACTKCASSVTKCPLCRKPFTDVMRVYFS